MNLRQIFRIHLYSLCRFYFQYDSTSLSGQLISSEAQSRQLERFVFGSNVFLFHIYRLTVSFLYCVPYSQTIYILVRILSFLTALQVLWFNQVSSRPIPITQSCLHRGCASSVGSKKLSFISFSLRFIDHHRP
jgi:hypothetical protein